MRQLITAQNIKRIALFLGLYLISTGISWAGFSLAGQTGGIVSPVDVGERRGRIDPNAPKTESCPLNGKLYTKDERAIWETRRPLTIMIENHTESRPPSGLSKADVLYEAVAEGGITRFLAVFYCGASAEDIKVAPVRSARVYYIDWASEYGEKPLFAHVGGANDFSGTGETAKAARALEKLADIGWRVPGGNDFDAAYDSGFPLFWRNYERLDHPVATEHTMMLSTDAAYEQAEKRGFGATGKDGTKWDETFTPWKFGEDKTVSSPTAVTIKFNYWDSVAGYDVEWQYDATSNSYKRFNGGQPHTDLENGEQLSVKNVAILLTREQGPVDRNKHLLYQITGSGNALVFQNGTVTQATWQKKDGDSRTVFFDGNDKEIAFVQGTIWIEVVAIGTDVQY